MPDEPAVPDGAAGAATPPPAPPDIPEAKLDIDALRTVQRLRRAGHAAYFVGGCVRDLLLGHKPKDFDIATSAHPQQVKETFRNCRLVGRRFRLAHVFYKSGKIIEVSTFRAAPVDVLEDLPPEEQARLVDVDRLITRDNVFGSAEEDARRRDFTVNALFYDPEAGRVIDYVAGRADLESRLMRTIGEPQLRMREDPVRILRAVRFSARLGFTVEAATWKALKDHVKEIPRCAPPRVLEEILKLLRSGASRRCFEMLVELDALKVLLAPVAQSLEDAGEGGPARFFAALEAMDEHLRSGERPDDAVLLAATLLWLPRNDAPHAAPMPKGTAERVAHEPPPSDEEAQLPWSDSDDTGVDDVLADMVRTARLPRRIAERCRLLLAALPVMLGQRRRRKFNPQAFAEQHHFHDALTLLEIYVRATGEGADAFSRWAARATGEEVAEPPPSPTDVMEEPGPRKKRRSRRGRRRGHGGPPPGAAG